MLRPSFFLSLVCAIGSLLAAGCESAPVSGVPVLPQYPEQAKRLGTLDIQVWLADDGQRVTLTNTTAQDFGPSRLWLNEWYSHAIDGLGVGQSLSIPVVEFRDEFGEPIRGGGFFATRAAEPVAKAELQTDSGVYGLVIVAAAE